MNNCCENAYQDGGTINQPQILDPEIIGGVLKGVTLNDGVTLDDTTASQLATRLCPLLNDCILEAVEGATLTGMKLIDTQLKGTVAMDADAISSVINNICSGMKDCIITAVQDNVLKGLEVEGMKVTGLSVTGSVTLDLDASKAIASAVSQHLDSYVLSVLTAGVIDAIRLSNASIDGLNLKGSVSLDDTAAQSIVDGICSKLTDCVLDIVKNNSHEGLKLVAPDISGAVKLDLDAANAIGEALAQKITDVVNDALTSGKLCCLHIEGAEINNSHGTNNTWTNTTLNGDTTINGNLTLDADAIANLCSSLQPCIDARFEELLNTRGRVVTDKETILGKGTDDDPLRANLETDIDERLLPAVTTQTELPTTIVGGRDQLLGKPDYYIRIGKHILPAWKG